MLLFFCCLPVLPAVENGPFRLAAKVLVDKPAVRADTFRRQVSVVRKVLSIFLKHR